MKRRETNVIKKELNETLQLKTQQLKQKNPLEVINSKLESAKEKNSEL